MILKNKFIKAGRILCRHRRLLPIIYVVGIIIYICSSPPFIFSGGSIFNDILACLFILLSFRVRWAAENRKSNTLKAVVEAKGIYSVIRFPYYLADFLLLFGITLFIGSAPLLLLFVLISIIVIERMIMFEEAISINKLGDVYEKWYRSTNAIIPIIWDWRGAVYTKNLFHKVSSMFKTLLFTIFTLNVIHIITYYRINFTFPEDYLLIVLFFITLVGYVFIRFIGRR